MDRLRLVSRKVGTPKARAPRLAKPALKKTWLHRTLAPDGAVKPAFHPLIRALAGLDASCDLLQEFNNALSVQNVSMAREIWSAVLQTPPGREDLREWSQLAAELGGHGPERFASALNKLARQHVAYPDLIAEVLVASCAENAALVPYIVGTVLEKVAARDVELAVQLFNKIRLNKQFKALEIESLGLDAMLYGVKCEPASVAKIVQTCAPAEKYRVPNKLLAALSRHGAHPECAEALLALAPFIKPSMEYDRLLRRVYTNSDRGAEIVEQLVLKHAVPTTFYPFVVKRLCEQVSTGRREKLDVLNTLFDTQLLRLAADEPGVLLHLLVLRTIAIEGVAATAPILNQWQASDGHGVSRDTWMVLFTTFRHSGHPDKCLDILGRVLAQSPKVDARVVSEYLHFTAHYYHLHVYLSAFAKVLPEGMPTLARLGVLEYAQNLPDPMEPPLCQLKPQLTAENREFAGDFMHETWLVATYNAVLSTVESADEALTLYTRYFAYARTSRSPTSLKVTDHFVSLLATMQDPAALDAAEHIFRRALRDLPLQIAVDGRNHAGSLEMLCYHFARRGQFDRAFQLLVHTSEHPRAVIRGSALQPVLDALPSELRGRFGEWAKRMGAHMDLAEAPSQEIRESVTSRA